MNHGSDVSKPKCTVAGQPSVNTLAEATKGTVHLVVTFEIMTVDQRTGNGTSELSGSKFMVSGADGDLVDERESPDAHGVPGEKESHDVPNDGDTPGVPDEKDRGTHRECVSECEPFVGSVLRPEASDLECDDAEFGEVVDVESLVSYLGMDFVEHELFVDRFLPESGDVVYTSRGVGAYQLLCVYTADRGLLVVVDEGEAIQPLVDHARSLLMET